MAVREGRAPYRAFLHKWAVAREGWLLEREEHLTATATGAVEACSAAKISAEAINVHPLALPHLQHECRPCLASTPCLQRVGDRVGGW
jgi:hypothetical protein